jgi:glycosyltransferase involved in cell wall biosynthesis
MMEARTIPGRLSSNLLQKSKCKGICFMKNFGKSQALHAGFAKAQGDVIITMDADLQDSPEEIPGTMI